MPLFSVKGEAHSCLARRSTATRRSSHPPGCLHYTHKAPRRPRVATCREREVPWASSQSKREAGIRSARGTPGTPATSEKADHGHRAMGDDDADSTRFAFLVCLALARTHTPAPLDLVSSRLSLLFPPHSNVNSCVLELSIRFPNPSLCLLAFLRQQPVGVSRGPSCTKGSGSPTSSRVA